jgi:perosamine synthetase
VIPVSKVQLGEEEEALVLQVVRSGQLAQGAMVERFENRFAEIHGVKHAITVNNGTTALIAALEVLDLPAGAEVVTSPFTFVATLNAIIGAGAVARFADIGDDFNVDAKQLVSMIGPKTKVLMPVHLYGLPVDLGPMVDAANTAGLMIVEDAAQAIVATYGGRAVGNFGLGCFSLYATKNLTTGEGGVITTNDDRLAEKLRILRNQGMKVRYQYEVAGNNYRLTDLAAAVGIPQLERICEVIEKRQRNAKFLQEGLAGIPGLVVPSGAPEGRSHVWHQFTVRITDEADLPIPGTTTIPAPPAKRDTFMTRLAELGVGSGVYYPRLVHDYECYQNHPQVVIDETPNAKKIVGEVVSLPVHPFLSEDDLQTIVKSVRMAMGVSS